MSTVFSAASLQKLYQYAYSLCTNEQDAYDLLQASLERFLKGNHQNLRDPESYMRVMIRNRYIDQYRQQQRVKTESYTEAEPYDISPIDLERWVVNQQTFENVWRDLSADDRDALYHWVILGYSTDEVCAQLGVSRGTFLSRMHRLRKKLQKHQPTTTVQEG